MHAKHDTTCQDTARRSIQRTQMTASCCDGVMLTERVSLAGCDPDGEAAAGPAGHLHPPERDLARAAEPGVAAGEALDDGPLARCCEALINAPNSIH